MARISGIWTSPGRKSGVSVGHERRRAIAGQGLDGCAHANPPRRDDVQGWPIGQRVRVGDEAVFEITMVCDPCQRMDDLRPGLRAELDGKRGMLARIVESGEVAVGDAVELI
jgi:hypothetical protein